LVLDCRIVVYHVEVPFPVRRKAGGIFVFVVGVQKLLDARSVGRLPVQVEVSLPV
jgi:hypothetical protein